MLLDLPPSKGTYPFVGFHVYEQIIRNLSLELGKFADFTANAIATQQRSLHSLAKVVLSIT